MIIRGETGAPGNKILQTGELAAAKHCSHVCEVVLVTRFKHLGLRGPASGLTVIGIDTQAMEFKTPDLVEKLSVV